MKPKSVTKKEAFLLYIFYLFLPYIIQLIASATPILNNYYSFQALILNFLGDFNFNIYKIIPLIISFTYAFIPAAVIGLLAIANKFFQKLALIAGPILGIIFTLYAYYVVSQPCMYFGCFAQAIIPLYVGYYWAVLIALLPITWGLLKPTTDIASILKRTIVPALILIITYGLIVSVIAYPTRAKSVEEKRQESLEVQQYKSKMNYLTPQYLPKKVGKIIRENISSDLYNAKDYFSVTGTDTVGVHAVYSCGGERFGYESFTLVEGPIIEQKLSLEEIYQGLLNYSKSNNAFRTVEKVNIANGWGIYKEFQMQGASDAVGAGLFYDDNGTRVELIVYEACVDASASLKDEVVRVANSLR